MLVGNNQNEDCVDSEMIPEGNNQCEEEFMEPAA